MPYTDTTPPLPFTGRPLTVARECSKQAAIAAAARRPRLRERYLALFLEYRRLTDAGAADLLGCPVSSICSTRNGLIDEARRNNRPAPIVEDGTTKGRWGTDVTVWRLA